MALKQQSRRDGTANDAPPPQAAPLVTPDYLTPAELAREFGISPRTLARWDVERVGPPRTVIHRKVLYRRSTVLEWLSSREERRAQTGSRGGARRGK